MKTYVYLLRAGVYCKVGITRAIDSRMRMIRTANAVDVHLLASEQYDNAEDALSVERALHNRFSFLFGRMRGEWFNYHPLVLDEFFLLQGW